MLTAEILTQQYFGNTVMQYLLFFATIILAAVIGKIVAFVIKNYLKRAAEKTKTKMDDVLIATIEKPIILIVLVFGIGIALQFLTLAEVFSRFAHNLLNVVAIVAVAWFLVRIVDSFSEHFLKPFFKQTGTRLDDTLLPVINKGIKYAIIAFAFIIILSAFGYDITAIVAGLGIGGLAIAFAAKETIADAFGGLSIFASRPFVIGDWVKINNIVGRVEDIGLRYTRIRNLDKRIVTIPNSKLASSIIENISSAPKRRIVLDLGLTYNTGIRKFKKAKEIVREIINKHPGCEDEPIITFSEFKDFSLNLKVIYYIKDKDWIRVRGEINEAIKEEFEKAKIEFAFPTQTIYLEKA
ncbi:MAG: mechanosensitive ion channel family protein [Candidatus Diapherotrites archaeon]|nr:mechanosensitive ion channel family protein [Candidatus Diapherotrites archaeon]